MIPRVFALPLVLLLALQSASPCLASCHAARTLNSDPEVAPEPAVPACHAAKHAQARPQPAPNGDERVSFVAFAGCCCLADAPARNPAEEPVTVVARGGISTNLEFVASNDTKTSRLPRVTAGPRSHGDLSPPRAPLFIAHHSLLI